MRNKDEIKGKGKRIKGKIKDKVGEVIGNRELESEGEMERIEGAVQENIGRARRKAHEIIEKVEDDAKRKKG
jgi:uncharacterized protein YjbJ (UPF0337 family)